MKPAAGEAAPFPEIPGTLSEGSGPIVTDPFLSIFPNGFKLTGCQKNSSFDC